MNTHLHFHVFAIDGVFFGENAGSVRFRDARLATKVQAQLQVTLGNRIAVLFFRRGLLDKAEGEVLCHCEHGGGFSRDASIRIGCEDRQGRERLLRYCARPGFLQERLWQTDAEPLAMKAPGYGRADASAKSYNHSN